jgi:hypothetical protein
MTDVKTADINRYIKPNIKEMYAQLQSAAKEHMVLVKSQYETGLSRASQEGGFSIASALDISNINPVQEPTPAKARDKGGRASSLSPPASSFSPASLAPGESVASFAKSAALRDLPDTGEHQPEPQHEPGADRSETKIYDLVLFRNHSENSMTHISVVTHFLVRRVMCRIQLRITHPAFGWWGLLIYSMRSAPGAAQGGDANGSQADPTLQGIWDKSTANSATASSALVAP